MAQWLAISDAIEETIGRLDGFDDIAPHSLAFLQDLLARARVWTLWEMWAVLSSGDMGADPMLERLRHRHMGRPDGESLKGGDAD
jgi:hypothetical protein